MDIINFGVLLVLLLNILLGFVLYKNNKKSLVNRNYIFVIATILLWGIGMIFYRIVGSTYVLLWCKLLYTFATMTAPAFLFFSFVFPEGKITQSKKFLSFIALLFIIINVLIFFSDTIIKDVTIPNEGENIITFGSLYFLYVMYFFYHFFFAFFKLFLKVKRFDGIKKVQVKYVFTGYFLASNLAFGTNLLMPWVGIFVLNWMGQVLTILMVGFTTYAIVRYRLLNIRFIITRSILYTILVGTVASFFALAVFLSSSYLGASTRASQVFVYIISSIIVVVFLDPVKRVWAKVTDSIFYKDKIDYQAVLRQASNVIAKEIDLDDLSSNLVKLLAKEIKLKSAMIFMPQDHHFDVVASSDDRRDLRLTQQTTQYFFDHHNLLITEELSKHRDDMTDEQRQLELDNVIRELEQIKADMVVPIIENNRVISLLFLGNKLSGDIFDNADIDFFKLLAPQIAMAIEKSKLYEEVQEAKEDLQLKVEERTESLRKANVDLEARNRYLTTMQVIINMVSRTLDLKKVTQMIADSIASELGHVGGVLSFINGDNKLRVKAVTQNREAKSAINLLPEDIFKYEAELKEDYNLGAKTILSKRINFSTKMTDFFSPPVEEKIIEIIQAKLGVKTVIGVPIFSEDKIIGVIHFLLADEREDVSSLDIEMMTSLTNQVGIVSRNLELYDNLQKVNVELHEANLHLKALDKAKSEFLSIASHQLRTPVSAIKGYLSMMLDGDFGPMHDRIKKLVGDLFESSARLARVINIFLNVSRIEAGRLKLSKTSIQIEEMITSVVMELTNSATSKGLKLIYNKPKITMPLIYADSDKLREVVLNLVDNAIKYTPKGSVEISIQTDQSNLIFMCQDSGIGIDPEEAKTLFRKFVRGDGVAQIYTGGSGLGLFIAQKIVKEHEGRIWVESEGKGHGSTFKFEIPLATSEQTEESEKKK